MKMQAQIVLPVFFFVWLLSGCVEEQRQMSSTPLTITTMQKAPAMEVAQGILRDMQFDVEKFDVDRGMIRTRPLSGAQFFEFWRQDNATPLATAESSLHSLRRTVELLFTTESDEVIITCTIQVKRLSIPEMEIAGMTQAASLYTHSDASLQQLRLNAEQARNMAWIDLGRDPALERRILTRILAKVKQLEGGT
ncbi:MAG: hypothetical protein JXA82_19710 [Sedimentisphaerales bacterium]|nr:hypothetical protein [Sedimentisphaerales bacterium]